MKAVIEKLNFQNSCSRTVIRPAQKKDATVLSALGALTFYETYAANNTNEDLMMYLNESFNREKIAAEINDPVNSFFIAELNGYGVGYLKMSRRAAPPCVKGKSPVELSRIYVLNDLIGHGIGRDLMQTFFEKAVENGFQTMWLIVWKENERALNFYKKWNFSKVGEHAFRIGSNFQRDWVMQRSL